MNGGRRGRVRAVGTGLQIALSVMAASFVLARFASSVLYEVSPLEPASWVGATLGLMLTTVVACYVPASRAASHDPISALRAD